MSSILRLLFLLVTVLAPAAARASDDGLGEDGFLPLLELADRFRAMLQEDWPRAGGRRHETAWPFPAGLRSKALRLGEEHMAGLDRAVSYMQKHKLSSDNLLCEGLDGKAAVYLKETRQFLTWFGRLDLGRTLDRKNATLNSPSFGDMAARAEYLSNMMPGCYLPDGLVVHYDEPAPSLAPVVESR